MKLLTQWAVTSSVLILIVLAARYLFRDKLSARLKYALWGVVLLRLLVPFQVELPANTSAALPVLATNLAQDVSPRLEDTMLYAVPTEVYPGNQSLPEGNPVIDRTLHTDVSPFREYYSGGVVIDREHTTHYLFMMPASELLVMIWGTGMALCLIFVFYTNRRFSMRLGRRRRRLEVSDSPVPVYTAEGLSSPCLFGVLRPSIYVTPQAAANPDTLRHVLAHELTHYAHFDHIWSLLRVLALALHWYNPLVWLAVWLSKGDGELACDEGAVARLGEEDRVPYGRTLVDMVAARSARPGDLLSCSTAMTGGGKSIQRRVAQIVKKPETVKAALFAAVAVVALAVVFVFAGREDNQILEAYRDTVTQANSVAFVSSPLSGGSYPTIIDDDSVSQAKEILLDISPLKSGEKPDLTGLASAPSVFLFGTYDNGTLMQQQYTLLSQDGHTYVLAWSSQPDGSAGYETLGYLPDNVCARLDELSRQYGQYMDTQIRSPELTAFLRDVESASSIRYSPPLHSSTIYPNPITSEDLLAQAKEALRSAAPLGPDDPGPDRGTLLYASTVSLTLEDGSEVYYTLLRQDSYTYVLEGAVTWYEDGDTQQGPWYSAAFRSEEDIISILERLARQSPKEQTSSGSPELTAFLRDMESASSIRYSPQPTISAVYPEPITDPRLLALAREKLCRFVLPEENNTPPDPKKLMESSRIVLSDGTRETTYTLVAWNDWTWLIPGDALSEYLSLEEGEVLEYGPIFRSQARNDMIPSIARLAQIQEFLSQDPAFPVPMTRDELGEYSLADICQTLGYQLQGWSGDPEDAELVSGYTTPERVQLMYFGDETHLGLWILELLAPEISAHASGYTVVSDQPSAVFGAAQYRKSWSGWSGYEMTPPETFAACLEPEDVVSVTAGDYNPGQEISLDLPALKDQLTQALYHQFSTEYDREKHGQYVLTVRVKGSGRELYDGHEIAEDADRLTLSAGSEKDVVCLSHRNFAATPEPTRVFVRSPELYRTIRNLFD